MATDASLPVMADTDLANRLRSHLLALGADEVGFADLTAIPAAAGRGLPRAVAFGIALDPRLVERLDQGPDAAYQAEYDAVNRRLAELATGTATLLTAAGHRAEAAASTLARLPEGFTTPLPHKTVATRAGLGWIGRCALLVSRRFGCALRISNVLTDAPLPTATPVDASACGSCRACVTACPGQAPSGREWSPALARADFFDADACFAVTQDWKRKRGLGRSICGICINACPHTRRWLAGGAGSGDRPSRTTSAAPENI